MAQDKCQSLKLIWVPSRIVFDNVVTGGHHRSLPAILRHHKKVVFFGKRYNAIDNGPRTRIGFAGLYKQPRIDSLCYDDVSQNNGFVFVSESERFFDRQHLMSKRKII